MRSIHFPDMFGTNNTKVWPSDEYKKSTLQNTEILLQCERGELFGDPYFGILLKHYLFSPNSSILADQIKDVIYTQLALFVPQLRIDRNKINLYTDEKKGVLYCDFKAINQIDYTPDSYSLVVYKEGSNNQ